MSPKLVVFLSFGTGGVALGGYTAFNYVHGSDIIITENPTISETTGSTICKTPIKQVELSNDQSVMYYICTTIENSTPSGTTTPTPAPILKTFTSKSTFTQKTTSSIATTPNHWSYQQDQKTTAIDIYWYVDTTKTLTDIFFMKTSEISDTTVDLTTENGIKSMVKDVEQFRIYRSIAITTTSETQTEDSISCATPKKATITSDKDVEYYICTSITETTSAQSPSESLKKASELFTYDDSFKNTSGTKHTITKWKNKDSTDQPIFYWLQPTDDTETEIFFLSDGGTTNMSDEKAKELIFKITQFRKEQES